MTDETARKLFADHGLRCTRQRRDLLRSLAATNEHPTAEELHAQVQSTSPGTSLATVYNTLEALCDAGLCRRIATTEGGTRYDADVSEHAHVITPDGRVLDVPEDLGEQLFGTIPATTLQAIEHRLGVSIGRLSIQLHAG